MEAPRMHKEELKTLLDEPGTAIIDVRREPSEEKISGADIRDPEKVTSWMNKYVKYNTIVLYCA